MKIYDCFTFFNELDLLELRLEELYPYVDFFVISEGDRTHSGIKKEFIFEKNKKRYEKFLKKIIYLKVEMPEFNWFDRLLIKVEKKTHGFITRFIGSNFRLGKWRLDNFQRSAIIRGLSNCEGEDIILVSDLDEIPNPKKFGQMKMLLKESPKAGFMQKYFNHYLNGFVNDEWLGTRACTFIYLKRKLRSDPQYIRLKKFHFLLDRFGIGKIKVITGGGWHFNNVGKREEVIQKIMSKTEADLFKGNLAEKLRRNESSDYLGIIDAKLKYVPIDNSFPEAILKNRRKYSKFIKKI
ncbi:MAG: hypothetical protein KGH55_00640 [Nanoarchaeota archaeon]|nr:hypothetical protein [Nanoarchaeota archaeon]